MKHFLIIAAVGTVMLAGFTACRGGLTASGLDPAAFRAEYKGAATALYTLSNYRGTEVCITNFGARVVSLMVPARDGAFRDVVLGFDNVQDYFPENNSSDFGAVIGRYANRIAQGRIVVEGVEYQLPRNNFGHCLHGGPDGWQYRVFDVVEADRRHVKMSLVSPDGDSGFPGEVRASVVYTLTDDNKLDILYEATSDAPTVINMTNHSYFNLAGDPLNHSICQDSLSIEAAAYTPVDDTFMTTGEIASVEGTPMDFRSFHKIGDRIDEDFVQLRNGHGYDHNWVLKTRRNEYVNAAEVYCPESGISLRVYTNEPGIQVYCGNFLDGSVTGKGGVAYPRRSAICLETQHYPDTPNKPSWPSAVLKPGQTYRSHCVYAFGVR